MNFTLRPWQMTDASVIAPYADDPLVAQNLRDVFPNPYTVADAEEFIRSCMEREGQGQMCRAIVADGKAVGSISLVLGSLKQIQSGLVLEAIAKAENIEVSEEDIDAEIEKMAGMYGMEADKLKEYMGDGEKESMKKDLGPPRSGRPPRPPPGRPQ